MTNGLHISCIGNKLALADTSFSCSMVSLTKGFDQSACEYSLAHSKNIKVSEHFTHTIHAKDFVAVALCTHCVPTNSFAGVTGRQSNLLELSGTQVALCTRCVPTYSFAGVTGRQSNLPELSVTQVCCCL